MAVSSGKSSFTSGPFLRTDGKLAFLGSSGIILCVAKGGGSQTEDTRDSFSSAPPLQVLSEGTKIAEAEPAQSFTDPLSVSHGGNYPEVVFFSLGRASAP